MPISILPAVCSEAPVYRHSIYNNLSQWITCLAKTPPATILIGAASSQLRRSFGVDRRYRCNDVVVVAVALVVVALVAVMLLVVVAMVAVDEVAAVVVDVVVVPSRRTASWRCCGLK